MVCHCHSFGQHACSAGAEGHPRIDGREVPVLRANQLFRAVYTAAGRHALRFYYQQSSLLPGAIISALTCVLLAGLCFFERHEIPGYDQEKAQG